MADQIDERRLRNLVRNYVDPLITKLQERIYGSGTSYNTTIVKTVLPSDTIYEGDIDAAVTNAGFIKGISTYLGTALLGSQQKEISMSGVGGISVQGSILSTKTSYLIDGSNISASGLSSSTSLYPDTTPANPSIYDDEFNSGTLNAKWTLTNTSSVPYTINSIPSRIMFSFTGNYITSISQTASGIATSGIAFSITTKVHSGPWQDFCSAYMDVGQNSSNFVRANFTHNSSPAVAFDRINSGVGTNVGIQAGIGYFTTMFLHLQRDSSNVWSMWWSTDGIGWRRFASTYTNSWVIGYIALTWNMGGQTRYMQAGADWIRLNWLTL